MSITNFWRRRAEKRIAYYTYYRGQRLHVGVDVGRLDSGTAGGIVISGTYRSDGSCVTIVNTPAEAMKLFGSDK